MDFKDIGAIVVLVLFAIITVGMLANVTQNFADDEAVHVVTAGARDLWHPANTSNAFSFTTPTTTVWSGLIAYNATSGNAAEIVLASNYTVDYSAGTIILVGSALGWNNTDINLTYNYTVYGDSKSFSILNNGTSAFNKIGKNMPTLGLLLAAGIIIGSLYFMYQAKFKGGS